MVRKAKAEVQKKPKVPGKKKVRPWGKEDLRALKTMAQQKQGASAIAAALGRSSGAIYQQASKHGLHVGVRRSKPKSKR
jgi:hypothetical protein